MAFERIEAPVSATAWTLERRAGHTLAEGETILVIESMKKEIPIDAPAAGTLRELLVAKTRASAMAGSVRQAELRLSRWCMSGPGRADRVVRSRPPIRPLPPSGPPPWTLLNC